jgi:hypothetical protein
MNFFSSPRSIQVHRLGCSVDVKPSEARDLSQVGASQTVNEMDDLPSTLAAFWNQHQIQWKCCNVVVSQ